MASRIIFARGIPHINSRAAFNRLLIMQSDQNRVRPHYSNVRVPGACRGVFGAIRATGEVCRRCWVARAPWPLFPIGSARIGHRHGRRPPFATTSFVGVRLVCGWCPSWTLTSLVGRLRCVISRVLGAVLTSDHVARYGLCDDRSGWGLARCWRLCQSASRARLWMGLRGTWTSIKNGWLTLA